MMHINREGGAGGVVDFGVAATAGREDLRSAASYSSSSSVSRGKGEPNTTSSMEPNRQEMTPTQIGGVGSAMVVEDYDPFNVMTTKYHDGQDRKGNGLVEDGSFSQLQHQQQQLEEHQEQINYSFEDIVTDYGDGGCSSIPGTDGFMDEFMGGSGGGGADDMSSVTSASNASTISGYQNTHNIFTADTHVVPSSTRIMQNPHVQMQSVGILEPTTEEEGEGAAVDSGARGGGVGVTAESAPLSSTIPATLGPDRMGEEEFRDKVETLIGILVEVRGVDRSGGEGEEDDDLPLPLSVREDDDEDESSSSSHNSDDEGTENQETIDFDRRVQALLDKLKNVSGGKENANAVKSDNRKNYNGISDSVAKSSSTEETNNRMNLSSWKKDLTESVGGTETVDDGGDSVDSFKVDKEVESDGDGEKKDLSNGGNSAGDDSPDRLSIRASTTDTTQDSANFFKSEASTMSWMASRTLSGSTDNEDDNTIVRTRSKINNDLDAFDADLEEKVKPIVSAHLKTTTTTKTRELKREARIVLHNDSIDEEGSIYSKSSTNTASTTGSTKSRGSAGSSSSSSTKSSSKLSSSSIRSKFSIRSKNSRDSSKASSKGSKRKEAKVKNRKSILSGGDDDDEQLRSKMFQLAQPTPKKSNTTQARLAALQIQSTTSSGAHSSDTAIQSNVASSETAVAVGGIVVAAATRRRSGLKPPEPPTAAAAENNFVVTKVGGGDSCEDDGTIDSSDEDISIYSTGSKRHRKLWKKKDGEKKYKKKLGGVSPELGGTGGGGSGVSGSSRSGGRKKMSKATKKVLPPRITGLAKRTDYAKQKEKGSEPRLLSAVDAGLSSSSSSSMGGDIKETDLTSSGFGSGGGGGGGKMGKPKRSGSRRGDFLAEQYKQATSMMNLGQAAGGSYAFGTIADVIEESSEHASDANLDIAKKNTSAPLSIDTGLAKSTSGANNATLVPTDFQDDAHGEIKASSASTAANETSSSAAAFSMMPKDTVVDSDGFILSSLDGAGDGGVVDDMKDPFADPRGIVTTTLAKSAALQASTVPQTAPAAATRTAATDFFGEDASSTFESMSFDDGNTSVRSHKSISSSNKRGKKTSASLSKSNSHDGGGGSVISKKKISGMWSSNSSAPVTTRTTTATTPASTSDESTDLFAAIGKDIDFFFSVGDDETDESKPTRHPGGGYYDSNSMRSVLGSLSSSFRQAKSVSSSGGGVSGGINGSVQMKKRDFKSLKKEDPKLLVSQDSPEDHAIAWEELVVANDIEEKQGRMKGGDLKQARIPGESVASISSTSGNEDEDRLHRDDGGVVFNDYPSSSSLDWKSKSTPMTSSTSKTTSTSKPEHTVDDDGFLVSSTTTPPLSGGDDKKDDNDHHGFWNSSGDQWWNKDNEDGGGTKLGEAHDFGNGAETSSRRSKEDYSDVHDGDPWGTLDSFFPEGGVGERTATTDAFTFDSGGGRNSAVEVATTPTRQVVTDTMPSSLDDSPARTAEDRALIEERARAMAQAKTAMLIDGVRGVSTTVQRGQRRQQHDALSSKALSHSPNATTRSGSGTAESSRIDAVEAAAKRRIEMLRKMIAEKAKNEEAVAAVERGEGGGNDVAVAGVGMQAASREGRSDAMMSQLAFIEAETLKQIQRVRGRMEQAGRDVSGTATKTANSRALLNKIGGTAPMKKYNNDGSEI